MSWKWYVRACFIALLLLLSPVIGATAQHTEAAEAIRKNLLFALVDIDGYGEHSLVLDTGASATVILNYDLGRRLQLQTYRTVTLGGAGSNDCKAAVTSPVMLSVSGRKLQPIGLNVIDLSGIERVVQRPIEGVIGGRLFQTYAVALDFSTSRAIALAAGEHDFTGFTAIPLSSSLGLCCFVELQVSIAKRQLRGRFLIDTGAPSIDIALAPQFVRRQHLPTAATGTTVTLPTLCSTSSLLSYSDSADVHIGSIDVRQVNVLLSIDRVGAFANGGFDGVIGGGFLGRFGEAVLDVPNARLLIKSPVDRKDANR